MMPSWFLFKLMNSNFDFYRFRGFSIDSDLRGLTLSEGLKVVIRNPDSIEVKFF